MIAVNRFTLDNGLRVVHYEDKNSPMVFINTLYDVGSKDESIQKTGFAHLFEHLMFGGTPKVPSFDKYIQQAGGENNAWTSCDFTNYYILLPANNAEIGFWLESDRMNELDFSQKSLDVQRHVVCEEFKQRYLNQPYGNLSHYLKKLCFGEQHPYGWPTIGLKLSHIEEATLEDVKDFFYSHYAPNNAILSVVGNISLEETQRLVHKWYDAIPARTLAVRNIPQLPIQLSPKFLEVEEKVPTSMYFKVFHTGGRLTSDYMVSDFVSDVLSNGQSSRINQQLVKEKKVFSSARAYISGDIETGLFYFAGAFGEHTTLEMAEEAIYEIIDQICKEQVSEYETQKLRNKYEVAQMKDHMVLSDLASDLAYYEMLGDANMINQQVDEYRTVTPEMAQEFAQRTFTKSNSCTLFYKSTEK